MGCPKKVGGSRVKVEHSIGGMKRFKIVSAIFRGITESMDDLFEIFCGLWNHHLSLSRRVLINKGS